MTVDWLLRWIVGGAAILFGVYTIGFNWATIPWNLRLAAAGRRQHVSTVPIVGPLLVCIGAALALWPPTPHILWCWLVDWPTAALPCLIWQARR